MRVRVSGAFNLLACKDAGAARKPRLVENQAKLSGQSQCSARRTGQGSPSV